MRGPRIALSFMCSCYAIAGSSNADSCRSLASDVDRLACYDVLFPRGTDLTGAPIAVTEAAPTPGRRPLPGAVDEFGLASIQRCDATGNPCPPKPSASISAVVIDVQSDLNEKFVVSLDNGQAWRQIEIDPRSRPLKGATITIRRGALGSYLLITANRFATHVRRIR